MTKKRFEAQEGRPARIGLNRGTVGSSIIGLSSLYCTEANGKKVCILFARIDNQWRSCPRGIFVVFFNPTIIFMKQLAAVHQSGSCDPWSCVISCPVLFLPECFGES